jgi:spore coat-associated protein S
LNQQQQTDLSDYHSEIKRILEYYPVLVKKVTLLSKRGGRWRWLIDTDEGAMILKREPRKPEKMLFISGAHRHLQEAGFPIARLVETNDGSLCLDAGEYSYVLYEKYTGTPMTYYDKDHLRHAMAFKGEFHQKSKGYHPLKNSKRRQRLGKWDKLYRWKIQELEGFKLLAEKQENDPFSLLFLQHVDRMIERAKQAFHDIEQPDFQTWVRECFETNVFCEQDFTLSRLILKDGKPFMTELRSVNIDLPSRDLRVFLNKVMKKLSVWDHDLSCEMLRAYDKLHPLDTSHYRVLWIDLRFPHLFCSVAQNYFLREKHAWSDDKYLLALQNVIAVETSKEDFLDRFEEVLGQIKQ